MIDQHHRHFILFGDRGQHVAAQLALANPERRGGNIKDKVAAGFHQLLDGIDLVQLPVPELLVVPGVLADRERHLLAAELKERLLPGRLKIPQFIKDVVSRQQHLGLHEFHFPIPQQQRRVHDVFASAGLSGSYAAANNGDAARARCNLLG